MRQRCTILSFLGALMALVLSCGAVAQEIDTTGCYLRDPLPLGVCRVQSVTVDTTLDRIRITWRVNHSYGVAGYCICSGSPCLALDTLWSVTDTSFLCTTHDIASRHSYCVFAIDSCLHGGEMTDAVSNMVLHVDADSCSRAVRCTWNPATMAATDIRYVVWYWADGQLLRDTVDGCVSQVQLDTTAMRLAVRVQAIGGDQEVWSNRLQMQFSHPDSCRPEPQPEPPVPAIPSDPFVPNVFTPTLSTNSCFCPVFPPASTPDDYTLYIYNRVGILVFQTKELSDCWNGTYRGELLPRETYVYHITYRFADEIWNKTGTLLLLR